jgi:Fic family protein
MKPFSPPDLPLSDSVLGLSKLFRLAGKANQQLGRFDGCLEGVINKAVLVSPLATREAVLSARIEGTLTTMGEVLRYQAEGVEEREQVDEIREIVNYRRALMAATESLQHRPLTLQLIRQAHEILLDRVLGVKS